MALWSIFPFWIQFTLGLEYGNELRMGLALVQSMVFALVLFQLAQSLVFAMVCKLLGLLACTFSTSQFAGIRSYSTTLRERTILFNAICARFIEGEFNCCWSIARSRSKRTVSHWNNAGKLHPLGSIEQRRRQSHNNDLNIGAQLPWRSRYNHNDNPLERRCHANAHYHFHFERVRKHAHNARQHYKFGRSHFEQLHPAKQLVAQHNNNCSCHAQQHNNDIARNAY